MTNSESNAEPEQSETAAVRSAESSNKWKTVVRFLTFGLVFSPALPQSIEGLISRFRRRARSLTIFANCSVIGAVIVLLGGLYFFFYQSSEIALRDIQSRKLADKETANPVAALAQSYRSVRRSQARLEEHDKKIETAQANLSRLQRAIAIVLPQKAFNSLISSFWNTDHDAEPESQMLGLWTRLFPPKGLEQLARHRFSGTYDWPSERQSLNSMLEYLESPEAITDLRTDISTTITELTESYSFAEAEVGGLQDRLNEQKQQQKSEKTIRATENTLSQAQDKINSLTRELPALNDSQEDSTLKKAIIALKGEVSKRAKNLEQEIERERTQLLKTEQSLTTLKTERESLTDDLARANAERDLLQKPNDPAAETVSRNDVIFTITANLTRIGAVIVVVFFAQMFLAIYRYSIRLAGYYNGRADAMELIVIYNFAGDANVADTMTKLVPLLSPDSVDFSRPNTPTEDLTKLASAMKDLRG